MIGLVVAYSATVFLIVRFCTTPNLSNLHYVASKKLLKNHRLVAADIQVPTCGPGRWGWFLPDRDSLEGKYVTSEIPQSRVISIENLSDFPDVQLHANLRPVVFPLETQQQLAQFLDADSIVDVLGTESEPLAGTVRVHAVVCQSVVNGDKNPSPCYAILELSQQQEIAISKLKEKMRLVLTKTSQ
jgi:hypothetical protein